MENAGGSQTCEEGTCQVCDHIITANTFIAKACGVVFEIQRTPLNWKAKTKFCLRFNNYKSKHRSARKGKQNVPQKRFHSCYVQDFHKGIDD